MSEYTYWDEILNDNARLRADNARLRQSLKEVTRVVSSQLARGEETHVGEFERAWKDAHCALAATDASQWLAERERRVAERAWRKGFGTTDIAPESVERIMARDLDALLKEET